MTILGDYLMNENNPVYVFIPGNYGQQVIATISSIKKNCAQNSTFCILLSPEDKKFSVNCDRTIIKIISNEDWEMCQKWYYAERDRADITAQNYLLFLVSRYFPEFAKILLLETDMVVQKDLADLWQMAYEKNIKIGIVRPINSQTGAIDSNRSDYNLGLILIDTQYWTNNQLEDKCFDYVKKQFNSQGTLYRYYCQGAASLALRDHVIDDVYLLDSTYNYSGLGHIENIPEKLMNDAHILHWTGPRKPWLSNGLYKEYYTKNTMIN
jgi:lipopolysaccharide biosynthesis glycosyltransferase